MSHSEKRKQRKQDQRDKQRAREAKHEVEPTTKKKPSVQIPDDVNQSVVLWSFQRFDNYDWRLTKDDNHVSFREVAGKLRSYSERTWADILRDRDRDHSCDVVQLVPAAKKRLIELDMDDVGELLRFRFTGSQRLWGFRDRHYFIVLWWNPDHEVWQDD